MAGAVRTSSVIVPSRSCSVIPCSRSPPKCALDDQGVDRPAGRVLQQIAGHPRLAAVVPEVAGVENGLAVGFDEEGDAPVDGMIDGEWCDSEVPDPDGLPGDHFAEPGPVEFLLPAEHRSGEHHHARPGRCVHRNFGPREWDQPGVVEVGVTEEDRVRGRVVGVEQAGDRRDDPLGLQHLRRLRECGP
jgi:hypothetical protein